MSGKRYTKKEKRKFIEKYKKSGLSVGEFAKLNNIPYSTFRRWINDESNIETEEIYETECETQFGEMNLNELSTSLVLITDKIKIELQEGYNKFFLKHLMGVILQDVK